MTLPDDDTSFKPFCDIEQFLGELVEDDGGDEAKYSKGETEEIDGEETIEVISDRPDKGDVERLRPRRRRPLPGQASSGTRARIPARSTFSGFDEQPDVEAPAEDEQIALDELESVA